MPPGPAAAMPPRKRAQALSVSVKERVALREYGGRVN